MSIDFPCMTKGKFHIPLKQPPKGEGDPGIQTYPEDSDRNGDQWPWSQCRQIGDPGTKPQEGQSQQQKSERVAPSHTHWQGPPWQARTSKHVTLLTVKAGFRVAVLPSVPLAASSLLGAVWTFAAILKLSHFLDVVRKGVTREHRPEASWLPHLGEYVTAASVPTK